MAVFGPVRALDFPEEENPTGGNRSTFGPRGGVFVKGENRCLK